MTHSRAGGESATLVGAVMKARRPDVMNWPPRIQYVTEPTSTLTPAYMS